MKKHFETIAIRTQSKRTGNREHSVPLYRTSSFVFDNAEQGWALFADEIEGNIYSRFSNPNTSEFIESMATLFFGFGAGEYPALAMPAGSLTGANAYHSVKKSLPH